MKNIQDRMVRLEEENADLKTNMCIASEQMMEMEVAVSRSTKEKTLLKQKTQDLEDEVWIVLTYILSYILIILVAYTPRV